MNFERFRQSVAQRLQFQPPALFISPESGSGEARDDDWTLLEVHPDRIKLENTRTGHQVVLGSDHVHHYTSNPGRPTEGISYGFLTLNVQVFVCGRDVEVRPTRPGEPLAHAPPERKRSSLERAAFRARRQQFEAETRELLRRDTTAFRAAASELLQAVLSSAQTIGQDAGIKTVTGVHEQNEAVVFMETATLQLLVRKLYVNSAIDAHYLVRFFRGRLLTHDEIAKGFMLLEEPQELSRKTIAPTRTRVDEWAWIYGGRVVAAVDLAGKLLERLVELREQRQ